MIPLYKPKSKSYDESIKALLSLQSNANTMTDWINQRKFNKFEHEKKLNDEMEECLKMLDIDLSKQAFIHVAGTKGKGSTCALTESIIREQGFSTGLFTSPHLISPRERIKLNGTMISKDLFAHYFWFCWERLIANHLNEQGEPIFNIAFFRFLTLLAFRVFQEEKVECSILEVGIGGRVDATNITKTPVVTGISSLGFDHMNVLGDTLPEIAGEKAGIMKPNVPIFTVQQPLDAMEVIINNSKKVSSPLSVVPGLASYEYTGKISLEGSHQMENASLAVALSNCWLVHQNKTSLSSIYSKQQPIGQYSYQTNNYKADYFKPLPESFIKGLLNCTWPGRAQRILLNQNKLDLYLDGAHTPESSIVCLNWWKSILNGSSKKSPAIDENEQNRRSISSFSQKQQPILLFTCTGGRNPQPFLQPFIDAIAKKEIPSFKSIIIPEFDASLKHNTNTDNNSWECNLHSIITKLLQDNNISGVDVQILSIQDSIDLCTDSSNQNEGQKVLITGSLYLIGGVLKCLHGDE